MIRIESPTVARIEAEPSDSLREALTYRDRTVEFDLRRLKKSAYRYAADPEGYADELARLKAEQDRCLLFQDETGSWTHSGLAGLASRVLGCRVERGYDLPVHAPLSWHDEPAHEPWPHQLEAKRALLAVGHGAVEIAPGLGKSDIIEALVREVGQKALIAAPSLSIAQQLYDQLNAHLGAKLVGRYYDGHKQADSRIVVGTAQSLYRVDASSRDGKKLASSRVLVCDESHLFAAKALSKIALGVAKDAPYRWFFSGTQMRGDGADLLLEGIIGPIVFTMTTREGVEGGYLAEPRVRFVRCGRASRYESSDAARMTREHLYLNPNVCAAAAHLANRFVGDLKRPTLILIDEVEQFARLLPLLRHPAAFAHGTLQETAIKHGRRVAGNAAKVPESYRDSDPKKLVAEFNEGKWPILVGTSCVATGTDLLAPEAVIYLVGQKSEVAVKQALGRGTRGGEQRKILNPWTGIKKKDFFFVDIDVPEVPMLKRHAAERRRHCREVAGRVEEISWGGA